MVLVGQRVVGIVISSIPLAFPRLQAVQRITTCCERNLWSISQLGAFREVYNKTKPVILEPIMVVASLEFQNMTFTFLTSLRMQRVMR